MIVNLKLAFPNRFKYLLINTDHITAIAPEQEGVKMYFSNGKEWIFRSKLRTFIKYIEHDWLMENDKPIDEHYMDEQLKLIKYQNDARESGRRIPQIT